LRVPPSTTKALLDRRRFLAAGAGALTAATLAGRARPARAQSTGASQPFLLIVYASGGWDTALVFENKLGNGVVTMDAGSVAASGGGNLPFVDNPRRSNVKAFFATYGASCAIVNGLSVGSLDHRVATQRLLGTVPVGQDRLCDWGTYYAANLNPTLALPHVVIDAPFMPGQYESVATRLTTTTINEYLNVAPLKSTPSLGTAGDAALAAYRTSAFTNIDQAANTASRDAEKLRALADGEIRETFISAALTAAMAKIGAPSPAPETWVRNGMIAVELFAQGQSLAVTLQAGADNVFDTTTSNFTGQDAAYQDLFAGLTAIISYAGSRGVASNLTILVVSECGRAPLLNAQGGKGPWPYTSALLWGPLVNGGTVVGLTDAALRGQPIDPVFGGQTGPNAVTLQIGHLITALYLRAGVAATQILPGYQALAQILKEAS